MAVREEVVSRAISGIVSPGVVCTRSTMRARFGFLSRCDRVRMRGAFSQRFSAFHELVDSLGRVASAGHLCDFEGHGPRNSINLAGAKRQQQMPALKVRAANEVHHA